MDDDREDETRPTPESVFGTMPPVVPPPVPRESRPAGVVIGPERDVPDGGVSAGPLIEPHEAVPLDLDSLYGPVFAPDPANAEPGEIVVDKIVRDSRPLAGLVGGALGAAVLGAIWWAITRSPDPLVSADHVASPQSTWDAFRTLTDEDIFFDSILGTLENFALAVIVGGALGALVGTVAGSFDLAHAFLRPFIGLFRWLSPALLVVVAFLRWGSGESTWVPAAVGTAAGVAWATTAALNDGRRGFAKNQASRLVAGVRGVLPLTWALVYLGEHLTDDVSIGGQVISRTAPTDIDVTYVYLIVALLLALVVDGALRIAQHAVRDH